MKPPMVQLARAVFLAVVTFALCSCASTGSNDSGGSVPWTTTSDGIPIGRWKTVIDSKVPGMKVARVTNIIIFRPDGSGYRDTTWEFELPAGRSLSTGKFKGLRRISYTDQKTVGTIKRIGDKIFMYGDPNAKTRLVRGTPPGYTLRDYKTFGEAAPEAWDEKNSDPGVTIFEISGKNLIMTNSEDNNRWLYKWIGK